MLRGLSAKSRFFRLGIADQQSALTGAAPIAVIGDAKSGLSLALGGKDSDSSLYELRIIDVPAEYSQLQITDKKLLQQLLLKVNHHSSSNIIAAHHFKLEKLNMVLSKMNKSPKRKVAVHPQMGKDLILVLQGKDLVVGGANQAGNIALHHIQKIYAPMVLIPGAHSNLKLQ